MLNTARDPWDIGGLRVRLSLLEKITMIPVTEVVESALCTRKQGKSNILTVSFFFVFFNEIIFYVNCSGSSTKRLYVPYCATSTPKA